MVTRAIRCWMAWLGLWMPLLAGASTAIIYQPQLRDRSVAPAQWTTLFSQVRAQGFDTLVLQWTKYGEAFGDPAGHAWLLQRVLDARAAGLRIVLGLDGDPAFFQRQQAPTAALGDYLQTLSRRDVALARRWVDELGADAVAGWYLPIEIDDQRWRDPAAREALRIQLAAERRQLQRLARRPVYVTSFFAGHMAPPQYARLLGDIQRGGVRIWVQDGAGTGQLDAGERGWYLAALGQCAAAHASGVVYEIFRQTGPDTAFTATPLPAKAMALALAQRAPCGGDSVFFELRYLPVGAPLLPR